MKLTFFIDVTMICLISFFLLKNKRNGLENLFILMMVEFINTCYYAVLYINLDAWTIAKGTELFIIFRIYEVLLNPLLFLLYFNMLPITDNRFLKLGLTALFIGILFGAEQWLVSWNVIIYTHWQAWQSLIVLIFVLFITGVFLEGFQFLSKKEGAGN